MPGGCSVNCPGIQAVKARPGRSGSAVLPRQHTLSIQAALESGKIL